MNSNSKKSFARPPGIEIVGRVLSLNADDVQVGFRKILPNLESPRNLSNFRLAQGCGVFCAREVKVKDKRNTYVHHVHHIN